MWRWIYKESKVPYDDAKKLAQSMVTLEEEWNKKFIIKMPGDIKVIRPNEHKIDEPKNTKELIDILHHVSHYKKITNMMKSINFF